MTTPPTAVELIDNWLTTKQTVLWGSTWDVTNPDRRRLAAEWFKGQMDEVLLEMRRVVQEEVRSP